MQSCRRHGQPSDCPYCGFKVSRGFTPCHLANSGFVFLKLLPIPLQGRTSCSFTWSAQKCPQRPLQSKLQSPRQKHLPVRRLTPRRRRRRHRHRRQHLQKCRLGPGFGTDMRMRKSELGRASDTLAGRLVTTLICHPPRNRQAGPLLLVYLMIYRRYLCQHVLSVDFTTPRLGQQMPIFRSTYARIAVSLGSLEC